MPAAAASLPHSALPQALSHTPQRSASSLKVCARSKCGWQRLEGRCMVAGPDPQAPSLQALPEPRKRRGRVLPRHGAGRHCIWRALALQGCRHVHAAPTGSSLRREGRNRLTPRSTHPLNLAVKSNKPSMPRIPASSGAGLALAAALAVLLAAACADGRALQARIAGVAAVAVHRFQPDRCLLGLPLTQPPPNLPMQEGVAAPAPEAAAAPAPSGLALPPLAGPNIENRERFCSLRNSVTPS